MFIETYLAETLQGNLPQLNHKGYKGPFLDAHSGAIYVTADADPDWVMYCTPGWEGSTSLDWAVDKDGEYLNGGELAVEWTGSVAQDGALWRDHVTAILDGLRPWKGAPGQNAYPLDGGEFAFVGPADHGMEGRQASALCEMGGHKLALFVGYGDDDQAALKSLWNTLRGAATACLWHGKIDSHKRAQAIVDALCRHINATE